MSGQKKKKKGNMLCDSMSTKFDSRCFMVTEVRVGAVCREGIRNWENTEGLLLNAMLIMF